MSPLSSVTCIGDMSPVSGVMCISNMDPVSSDVCIGNIIPVSSAACIGTMILVISVVCIRYMSPLISVVCFDNMWQESSFASISISIKYGVREGLSVSIGFCCLNEISNALLVVLLNFLSQHIFFYKH